MEIMYKTYSDKYRTEKEKQYYVLDDINDLLEMAHGVDYFMIDCPDFDPNNDKSMWAAVTVLSDSIGDRNEI